MRKYSILFDVEGTLVDSVPLGLRSWQETLRNAGHAVSLDALQALSGMDGDDMLKQLLPDLSLGERKALLKTRGQNFERDYLLEVKPFPSVRDTLRSLIGRETALALATDCKGKTLTRYRDILGIDPLIETIACGEDAGEGKPAPFILRVALDRLGGLPANAVMVGDTPSEAKVAAREGMKSIGLLTGGFTMESLRVAGCAAVASDNATLPRVMD